MNSKINYQQVIMENGIQKKEGNEYAVFVEGRIVQTVHVLPDMEVHTNGFIYYDAPSRCINGYALVPSGCRKPLTDINAQVCHGYTVYDFLKAAGNF